MAIDDWLNGRIDNVPGDWLHPTDCMKIFRSVQRSALNVTALALLMLAVPASSFAQDPPPSPPDKPAAPTGKSKPAKPSTANAAQNAPDQPAWDPLRAEKDMEVGRYYMHKGDIDAAIDRFQDATTAKPGYALPFRLLAEAQEKKGLKKQAIKSYTRYLDLYPHAEDKDKIQKKIDQLYKEVGKEKKSAG